MTANKTNTKEYKQLAITIPRSIGDGDCVFNTSHLLVSDEDLNYIEESCNKIYSINNGNISSIKLDMWTKIIEFEDIYKFFILKEIPTMEYYTEKYKLLFWDDNCTSKRKFSSHILHKMLKIWKMGYTHVRTCFGNKEDLIDGYPGYYGSLK